MNDIVNILTFHHVSPHRDIMTIPPDIFEKTVARLSERYTFISYEAFRAFCFEGKPLPKKPILLTFDDGYLDNFLFAFPILKKYGIPAVLFVVTGMVERADRNRKELPCIKSHKELERNPDPRLFVNTSEIRTMESSGLMEIESHTVTHFVCKGKPFETVYEEMERSFDFIRTHTRPKERYGFCWPRGAFDETALEAIEKSPYDFAFSTIDGAFHRGDDLYTIRRVDCSSYDGDPDRYFARIRRKLAIYSNPLISRLYSDFREYRIRKKRAWKKR
ncbi:polysaccharide deacetylase family protein [Hydrogenimonas sp.]